jgi:hypothetical protein
MQPSRFVRFEPVTIRAAARVIRISWLGRVSPAEVNCYLLHLADLHPGRGRSAVQRLARVGRWRAALGDQGVPNNFRLRRSSRAMPGSYVALERTAAESNSGRGRCERGRKL